MITESTANGSTLRDEMMDQVADMCGPVRFSTGAPWRSYGNEDRMMDPSFQSFRTTPELFTYFAYLLISSALRTCQTSCSRCLESK